MFYGRKKEINLIKNVFKENNNAILIYGKRRVGKTTLIKESIKEYGLVIRKEKGDKDDIFIQENYYFLLQLRSDYKHVFFEHI